MSARALATLKGSVLNVIGRFLFITNTSLVKLCRIPETQIVFGRFGGQFVLGALCWIILKLIKHEATLHKHWYGDKDDICKLWTRGAIYFVVVMAAYYAVYKIPVGDASFLVFSFCPYSIVIFARIFLNERLPKYRVMIPCVLLFLVGSVLISQPTFIFNLILQNEEYQPLDPFAVCLAIFTGICLAVVTVLIRSAKHSHFLQLEITSSSQSTLLWIPLMMVLNRFLLKDDLISNTETASGWNLDVYSFLIMLAVGCIGFSALILQVIAYQYGEATHIAWLQYVQPVFGFLYQVFLFGDIPNMYELIGVVCIVSGCALMINDKVQDYYVKSKYEKCAQEELPEHSEADE